MKVKVKRYEDDPSKPCEERLQLLLAHHETETKWLIAAYDALHSVAPRTPEVKAALQRFGQWADDDDE